jgi:molecular chaperone GrpE
MALEEKRPLSNSEDQEAAQEQAQTGTPEETDDVAALRRALEEAQARAENNLAGWKRAQADYQNLRRRMEQEREEIMRQATAQVVLHLLPILDDLQRALEHVDAKLAGFTWIEGIHLIERKLHLVLQRLGVEEIPTEGQPFDPRLHEALMYEEGEEGMVLQELQKGYTFQGRVLRPALVKVGRRSTPSPESGPSEQGPTQGPPEGQPPESGGS